MNRKYYFYALTLSCMTITLSATVIDDLAACAVQHSQLKVGELDALMQGYIVETEKYLQELLTGARNSSAIITLNRTKLNHEVYLRYYQQLQAKVMWYLTKSNTDPLMNLLISLHQVNQKIAQSPENLWQELSCKASEILTKVEKLLEVTHLSLYK